MAMEDNILKNPTNHDLHIMLIEIATNVNAIKSRVEDSVQWQKEHEKKDEKRFNDLNKYGRSIAIVASGFSFGSLLLWQKIAGKL